MTKEVLKLFFFPGTGIAWFLTFDSILHTAQIFLGAILAVGTVIGIIYGIKWRTAYEVEAKVSEGRLHLADLKDRESKELHTQLLEAKDLIGEQKKAIEQLSALPNLERVLQLMGEMAVKQDAQATKRLEQALTILRDLHVDHEGQAEKRTQRILDAIKLGAIEDRRGPDG